MDVSVVFVAAAGFLGVTLGNWISGNASKAAAKTSAGEAKADRQAARVTRLNDRLVVLASDVLARSERHRHETRARPGQGKRVGEDPRTGTLRAAAVAAATNSGMRTATRRARTSGGSGSSMFSVRSGVAGSCQGMSTPTTLLLCPAFARA